MDGCFGCIDGAKSSEGNRPYPVDPLTRPEYETLPRWGLIAALTTLKAICKATNYAMPTRWIQFLPASAFLFAMECFEKELSRPKIPAVLKSGLGMPEVMLKLIEMIAFRNGFGDVLADGTAVAAKKIGKSAGELCDAGEGRRVGAA